MRARHLETFYLDSIHIDINAAPAALVQEGGIGKLGRMIAADIDIKSVSDLFIEPVIDHHILAELGVVTAGVTG